ncbi:MAG: LysM domain-containing protein [Anaerolineae bacterium]
MRRFLRNLFLLLFIVAVFAGVGLYIYQGKSDDDTKRYNDNVTRAINTAIWNALYDATRTLEADLVHYRLITVAKSESLVDVALRYHTTVEVLRMANNLLPTVDYGDGGKLIVPEGVNVLNPPRRFTVITAVDGDTLTQFAARYGVTVDILRADNPILAQRGIIHGDLVFIPELL